ncbi:response regulator [Roseateles sp. BYS96W]|uniref:Response regulator n=1 Tax=Pelomonas nitida TaxID=3299027 RepID=A0ABW7G3X3_9BURK
MTESTLNVLVVDDDDLTSEMVLRALRKVPGQFRVLAAADGQIGLDMLRGRGAEPMGRPLIVLLDLNMPRMNGFEFLAAIRQDAQLRDSVIFVLTTSDSDADRSRAYQELIAGYMVKSAVGPQFSKLAGLINEFSRVVKLPA